MSNDDLLVGRGNNPTQARRKPLQARALKRHEQILDKTAELLAQVGVDDLTTILIAKSLNISVGSLYHYFPNKMSILYALSQRWLDEVTHALDDIDNEMEDNEDLAYFVEHCTNRLFDAYRRQEGILHLVQAMFSIPELKALDADHDDMMVARFSAMFVRLGFKSNKAELARIARIYLELVHAVSLVILEHKGTRVNRTSDDLKAMALTLLSSHFAD